MLKITVLAVIFLIIGCDEFSSFVRILEEGTETDDIGMSVIQTSDGGYVVCGETSSTLGEGGIDVFVIKYDVKGVISWSKAYGTTEDEVCYSIVETADGQYFGIAGDTTSLGTYDFFVAVIYSSNGNIAWSNTYGGDKIDQAFSIEVTDDGGFLVGGASMGGGSGSIDSIVMKVDGSGSPSFASSIDTSSADMANHVTSINSGGYLVGGYKERSGHHDALIMKMSDSETMEWATYVGGLSGHEKCFHVAESSDGTGFYCGHRFFKLEEWYGVEIERDWRIGLGESFWWE